MIDIYANHWCVCTVCGIRNDPDNEESVCRNGHDSWLELRDFLTSTKIIRQACAAFGMEELELEDAYLSPEIKQFKIVKPIQI